MENLENQHRDLDRYIEWLQKVVILDVKLLYREMRWEKLCRYYEKIHAELQQRVSCQSKHFRNQCSKFYPFASHLDLSFRLSIQFARGTFCFWQQRKLVIVA